MKHTREKMGRNADKELLLVSRVSASKEVLNVTGLINVKAWALRSGSR